MNDSEKTFGMVNRAAMIQFFNCRHCGKCCLEIANIDLFPQDIDNIADFLCKDKNEVENEYTNPTRLTRKFGMRQIKAQPCPFYDSEGKTCKIYPARPLACRMYPFLTADVSGNFVNLTNCPSGFQAISEYMKSDLAKKMLSPSRTFQRKIFEKSLKDMEIKPRDRRLLLKSIGL